MKNLLEPLYCTLLQAPAGGPTEQPFTNKAGSTEAFLEKDWEKVFVTHDQNIRAGSVGGSGSGSVGSVSFRAQSVIICAYLDIFIIMQIKKKTLPSTVL